MASPDVFRDLIERLSQEHESLVSRYDELLLRHHLLQSGGDDATSSDQLLSATWRPLPAQPRRPPDSDMVGAGSLGHWRCEASAEAAAALTTEDGGEVVREVSSDASASFTSDHVVVPGPRQRVSSMPSVQEHHPADLDCVHTESCPSLAASVGMASTESTLSEKLHPEWALSPDEVEMVVARRKSFDGKDLQEVSGSMLHRYSVNEPRKSTSGCQRLMIEPNCGRKLAWDLIGMACLCWDVCTIPMVVFDIEEAGFTIIIGIAIAGFWTSDTVLSFFVGFYDNGRVELSPRKIWIRYIKSWFFADVALLIIDWAVIFLQFASASYDSDAYFEFMRIGRTWRFVRFIRVLRLLRIIKANQMFEELKDLIRSEVMQTVMIIAKLLWGIAMINHILACAWYGIGSSGPEEANWVYHLRATATADESSDTAYHYLSALHWSLTQFTPASMEVVPCNKWERLFTISTIMLALVVFSSFLSSITAAMTQLRVLKVKQAKTQVAIRRFSIDNNLSSELSLQVHRFARMHQKKSNRILMADLDFVRLLPESLRIRMHSEVYLPRLSKHPMFERWVYVDLPGLIKVCHTAMEERSLMAGEELFDIGDRCGMMYLALTGTLRYFYYDHTRAGDAIIEIVGKETEQKRISEMALWTPWDHRGRLVATSPSVLFTLNSARFRGVVKARSAFVGPAAAYARKYLSEILKAFDGKNELLLDVWDEADILERLAYDAFQAMDYGVSRHLQRMSSRVFGIMGSSLTKLLHMQQDEY